MIIILRLVYSPHYKHRNLKKYDTKFPLYKNKSYFCMIKEILIWQM